MGSTVQNNFEFNNNCNFSASPMIQIKDNKAAAGLCILSDKKMTSTVVSGNSISSIYMPTKVLDNRDNIVSPNRIAFSRNGTWAVADGAKYCVNIFDSQDKLIQVIDSFGHSEKYFKNPKGVAFDTDNCLYVVDSGNKRIVKFNTEGHYLLQFPTKESSSDPSGIVVHNDRVYVADSGNCHIAVFQTDGQFCFTFGSEEFGGILDISISADNHILVSNWSDEAIHIFTLDGVCISKFGR